MKILLDECVTKRLKKHLESHEISTVVSQGWSGLKNGQLLRKAIENKFDLLLTIDKNLRFQQNMSQYDLIVVVLDSNSSNIRDVVPLLPKFNQLLTTFQKGTAYIVTILK